MVPGSVAKGRRAYLDRPVRTVAAARNLTSEPAPHLRVRPYTLSGHQRKKCHLPRLRCNGPSLYLGHGKLFASHAHIAVERPYRPVRSIASRIRTSAFRGQQQAVVSHVLAGYNGRKLRVGSHSTWLSQGNSARWRQLNPRPAPCR